MKNKPTITKTDKLCLIGLAGVLITATLFYELTDGQSIRAAEVTEVDKPLAITITAEPIDCTPLVEAVESRREELFWQDIPLDQDCREALIEACEENNVPVCDVLGLIEVESGFNPDAVNGVCYGLCQFHTGYFPSDLTPAENIRAGVAYLGELLEKYNGDTAAALVAYNQGSYKGAVTKYAESVLSASEKWGNG